MFLDPADGHWWRGERQRAGVLPLFLFTTLLFAGSPLSGVLTGNDKPLFGLNWIGSYYPRCGNKRLYPMPICSPITPTPVLAQPAARLHFGEFVLFHLSEKKIYTYKNVIMFSEKFFFFKPTHRTPTSNYWTWPKKRARLNKPTGCECEQNWRDEKGIWVKRNGARFQMFDL